MLRSDLSDPRLPFARAGTLQLRSSNDHTLPDHLPSSGSSLGDPERGDYNIRYRQRDWTCLRQADRLSSLHQPRSSPQPSSDQPHLYKAPSLSNHRPRQHLGSQPCQLVEPGLVMATPFAVNMRLSIGDQRCTVKYVGPLPNTTPEGAPWLGVQWDDASRGKHDGRHEGVRYFDCS